MKTTLEKLFYGELYPCVQFEPKTDEYRDFRSELNKNIEKFSNKLSSLSPDMQESFISLKEDIYILFSMEMEALFYQSFSLGVSMIMESRSINNL